MNTFDDVELRYFDKAPTHATNNVQRIRVEIDGNVFELSIRNGGLHVRTETPIHHVMLAMPMGTNTIVLFHKPEP